MTESDHRLPRRKNMDIGEELRTSEERLRLIVESARDYAIFTTDPEGRIDQWYEGAASVFGWSADEIVGQMDDITFTPEDRAQGQPDKEREIASGQGRSPNVRWHLRKDGSRVFIEGHVTALRNSGGELLGFLKIGQDVTERHAADQRQKMLLAELQHRVRNTLAVVRSIARRTAETSDSVDEMWSHFQGRLDAFSRVQSVVTRSVDGGVELTSLIEDELLAHAAKEGEIVRIEGPEVCLKPRAAEALSLAIHELTTNAVKYGALSAGAGRLLVRWQRTRRGGEEWLELRWEEGGLDEPLKGRQREGFGMELLERSLPYDLGAQTEVQFRPEGLHFSLVMPLGQDALAD